MIKIFYNVKIEKSIIKSNGKFIDLDSQCLKETKETGISKEQYEAIEAIIDNKTEE